LRGGRRNGRMGEGGKVVTRCKTLFRKMRYREVECAVTVEEGEKKYVMRKWLGRERE
jgi:hypothetical protein